MGLALLALVEHGRMTILLDICNVFLHKCEHFPYLGVKACLESWLMMLCPICKVYTSLWHPCLLFLCSSWTKAWPLSIYPPCLLTAFFLRTGRRPSLPIQLCLSRQILSAALCLPSSVFWCLQGCETMEVLHPSVLCACLCQYTRRFGIPVPLRWQVVGRAVGSICSSRVYVWRAWTPWADVVYTCVGCFCSSVANRFKWNLICRPCTDLNGI